MANTTKLGLKLLEGIDVVDEATLDANSELIDNFATSIDLKATETQTKVSEIETKIPTLATSEYVNAELLKKQNTFSDEVLLDIASIPNKVDKEDGFGLSSNDFNDDYKTKLDGIADNADVTPDNLATFTYVDEKIEDLIGGATTETLDTISEIATALQNEEDATAAILTQIGDLKSDTVQSIKIKENTLTVLENNVNLPTFEIEITKLDGTLDIYDFVGIKR